MAAVFPRVGVGIALVLAVCAGGARADGLDARRAAWERNKKSAAGAVEVMDLDQLWDERDPREIAAFAAKAAAEGGAHPLAAAQARWSASLAARALGDGAGAAALRAPLGLLAGQALIAGPSRAVDAEAEAAVLSGAAALRPMPAALMLEGVIDLAPVTRGLGDGVATVVAWVKLPAGEVALRVGAGGPVVVWVDGGKVLAREGGRRFALDQDAVALKVVAGWHRVVVRAGARVAVRWTRLDGGALATTWSAESPATVERGQAQVVARAIVTTVGGAALAAESQAARGPIAGRRAAALVVARTRAALGEGGDVVGEAMRRAGVDAVDAPVAALLEATRSIGAPDVRRLAAERLAGRSDAPADARATAELVLAADALEERSRPAAAREAVLRAAALVPGDWRAPLRLAEIASDAGLDEVALARVETLAAARPDVGAIERVRARLARRTGRIADADVALARLSATRQAELGIWIERHELAVARGDDVAAARLLAEATAIDPASPLVAAAAADAASRKGDREGARKVWQALLEIAPEEPRAKAALAPATSESVRGADPLLAYARDPGPIVRAQARVPRAAAGATVLSDLEVTRLRPDGGLDAFGQRLVLVQDARGAEAQRTQELPFVPSTQTLDVLHARVWRDGAVVLEATPLARRSLSEPWANLHYDLEAERLRFDALSPGDVVELAWARRDTQPDPVSGGELGVLHALGEELPRRSSTWIVVAPEARAGALVVDAPGAKLTRTTVGGEVVVRVEAGATAASEPEDREPGWAERVPVAQASTVGGWDRIEARYRSLLTPQLRPDEAMRRAARDLTAKATTPDARVRALHELAARGTRYVGLELGVHGFQPYPAPVVFARRFGDCKDKATLLVSLLAEVGVPAHVVLVRTRGQGDVARPLPSLALFDHAIVWVPSLDLWIDATVGGAGVRELPLEDQARPMLVVGGDGKLGTTPRPPDARARVKRVLAATLSSDGVAELVEDVTVAGAAAARWRDDLASAEGRREGLEARWAGWFPGARVEMVDAPGVDRPAQAVLLRIEGHAPIASRVGDGLLVPGLGRASDLGRRFVRASRRTRALIVDPGVEEDTFVLTAPSGWRVRRRPAPVELASPFGTFALKIEENAGAIVVRSTVTIDVGRVEPGVYPAFRAWLIAVDAARDRAIEVGP